MKKIILFTFCLGIILPLMAQDDVACVPNQDYADSARVVIPLPFDPATGVGGIEAFPMCVGEPYELVFSFRIGDSATVSGFTVDILQASLEPTGAVEGLPEGINYFCNPPNCVFPDTLLGCIVLKGTPAENTPIGTNNLVISAQLLIDGFAQPIDETIPGNAITGEYNLVIKEAGACSSTGLNDYLGETITLSSSPNPVYAQTLIEVSSEINGDFQFQVVDVAGKLMHSENVNLTTGYNAFTYDASNLGEGMYIYSLSNELGAIAEKLIVGR